MAKNKSDNSVFTALDDIKNMSSKEFSVVIKSSKMQEYRDEVKDKLNKGRVDWMNTKIELSKRDMYSILAELDIDIMTKGTNFSKNFIDWDYMKEVFDILKKGHMTLAQFVRISRKVNNRDIGITTFLYKLREHSINKKTLGYKNEYDLLKKMSCKTTWVNLILTEEEIQDIKKLYMTGNFEELLRSYSVGEIAYVIPNDLKTLTEEVIQCCEMSKDIKKWVKFLNVWNPSYIEYRVENLEVFEEHLKNGKSIRDVAKVYGLPFETVRDYRKKMEV